MEYFVQESSLRFLFQFGAPRFEGAQMIRNIKILAFPDRVEFGSCLFRTYQGQRKKSFGYVVQKWRLLSTYEFWVLNFEEARINKQH